MEFAISWTLLALLQPSFRDVTSFENRFVAHHDGFRLGDFDEKVIVDCFSGFLFCSQHSDRAGQRFFRHEFNERQRRQFAK